MDKNEADKWAKENNKNEGYLIKFFETIQDIDRSDTGWELMKDKPEKPQL